MRARCPAKPFCSVAWSREPARTPVPFRSESLRGHGIGSQNAVVVSRVRGDEGALPGKALLFGGLVESASADAGAVQIGIAPRARDRFPECGSCLSGSRR